MKLFGIFKTYQNIIYVPGSFIISELRLHCPQRIKAEKIKRKKRKKERKKKKKRKKKKNGRKKKEKNEIKIEKRNLMK